MSHMPRRDRNKIRRKQRQLAAINRKAKAWNITGTPEEVAIKVKKKKERNL